MNPPVLGAHHDHRLAPDLQGLELARLRDLRLMAAIDPGSFEDVRHLQVEKGGVGVDRAVDAVGLDQVVDVESGHGSLLVPGYIIGRAQQYRQRAPVGNNLHCYFHYHGLWIFGKCSFSWRLCAAAA